MNLCVICNREIISGPSSDYHHFIPKSRGGKEKILIHRICHQKIHSLWTNKELEKKFFDPDVIKNQQEIIDFIKFLGNKSPEYYVKNKKRRN